MKEDYREKNWRERKTMLQEFDYYISSVMKEEDKKAEGELIKFLKGAFMAGASSTIANIAEQIHADDPREFVLYINSMHNQLESFIEDQRR